MLKNPESLPSKGDDRWLVTALKKIAYMAPEVPPMDDSIVLDITLNIETMSMGPSDEVCNSAAQTANINKSEYANEKNISFGLAYILRP